MPQSRSQAVNNALWQLALRPLCCHVCLACSATQLPVHTKPCAPGSRAAADSAVSPALYSTMPFLQNEIEKVRKRRADRELEKAQMEEEQALLARERAYAENLETAGKEEEVRCLTGL